MLKTAESNRDRKSKIIFIIPNFGAGGAERVLSIILKHLNRKRFIMVCIVYDDTRVYDVPDDVKIYFLDAPGTRKLSGKMLNALKRIFGIRKIIKGENPDVVFSFISTVNILVVLAWLLAGKEIRDSKKLYISVRTYPSLTLKGRLFWITRMLIRMLYPMAHGIIANAEAMKNDLIDNFGLPEEKIKVVYNPLDIDRIRHFAGEKGVGLKWFSDDIPIVINVGSVDKYYQKGHDFLLRSFRRVQEKMNCRLVIVGSGSEEKMLKLVKIAKGLGIAESVGFLGYQSNPFKFISKSSVFVLSSRWEGFPNALLEAMACGVPVISTRCPSGPEEIIEDRVNGLLVAVDDEKQLAEAIMHVISDSRLSASLAVESEKTAAKFDVATSIENYEKLFF